MATEREEIFTREYDEARAYFAEVAEDARREDEAVSYAPHIFVETDGELSRDPIRIGCSYSREADAQDVAARLISALHVEAFGLGVREHATRLRLGDVTYVARIARWTGNGDDWDCTYDDSYAWNEAEAEAEAITKAVQHWHVVQFVNGCMNDSDSGPYDTLEDARSEVQRIIDEDAEQFGRTWTERDVDTYVSGYTIMQVDWCSEPLCHLYPNG